MKRQQAVRAREVHATGGVNHPEKLNEAARRQLDVKLSRSDRNSTELLLRDTPEARRHVFRPSDGPCRELLPPLAGES